MAKRKQAGVYAEAVCADDLCAFSGAFKLTKASACLRELAACKTLASNFFSKRWAPKGCRLEGMILDTKGTRSFRCNAARACDHFRELERACRGGGEC